MWHVQRLLKRIFSDLYCIGGERDYLLTLDITFKVIGEYFVFNITLKGHLRVICREILSLIRIRGRRGILRQYKG
jgi:hypothetical protein